MAGGAGHAEVLRRLHRPRGSEEEREEHMLPRLLHRHLRPLRRRPLAPLPPPRAGAALRLPRRRPIVRSREAHRLLQYSGYIYIHISKEFDLSRRKYILTMHANFMFCDHDL